MTTNRPSPREAELLEALKRIERVLGILPDFVPLGPAVAVAQIIRDVRRISR